MAKKRERTRRPKQVYLPGTDPSIPEIDDLADRYVEARDQRQVMLADEIRLKEQLMGLMHEHKLKTYEYANKIVRLVMSEEKVQVKRKKAKKEKIDLNGEAGDA